MPTKYFKEYTYLHLAVLLFGFTAVLGELIQLSGLALVWWRMLFTTISFIFYPKIASEVKVMRRKHLIQFIGIGILVAIHWVLFYTAIKVSNASIAVVMIATVSFFVAFLEPLFTKSRIKKLEVGLGLLAIPGIYLMNQSGQYDYSMGIWIGLAAAFFAALFSVLNKVMLSKTSCSSHTITFIEMLSGFIFLSIFVVSECINTQSFEQMTPNYKSLMFILVLAILCTNIPFTLMLKAQEKLSAFTTNFALNLEPIYGVLLASAVLQQHKELDNYFYLGSTLIIMSVFLSPLLHKKSNND